LKPLPYPHPDELIGLNHTALGINIPELTLSPSMYFTYRDENRSFEDIGIYTGDSVSVTGLAEPEQVKALDVTDGVIPVLGVRPLLGRSFSRKDDSPGSPETVMLSYGYWQRRFTGNPAVLGRRLTIDGKAREVIGVMPGAFVFSTSTSRYSRPSNSTAAKPFWVTSATTAWDASSPASR